MRSDPVVEFYLTEVKKIPEVAAVYTKQIGRSVKVFTVLRSEKYDGDVIMSLVRLQKKANQGRLGTSVVFQYIPGGQLAPESIMPQGIKRVL